MHMTKNVLSAIITAGLALAVNPAELKAGPIIYGSAGFGTQLIKIDVATGHVTHVGDFGVFALGLAISPHGKLYTVTDSFADGCAPNCNPQLAAVDLSTGHATPYGNLHGEPFMGIAFTPDGALQGVNAMSGTPDAGSLFRFNVDKGKATQVGVTGGCFEIMDMAWSPDGRMYGAAWDSLYRVNSHTGKAKLITKIHGLDGNAVMGLAIDDDGNFYVSEIIPNASLFKVNPKSGATTRILLDTQIDYVHGLEFMPGHDRKHHGCDEDGEDDD